MFFLFVKTVISKQSGDLTKELASSSLFAATVVLFFCSEKSFTCGHPTIDETDK